MMDDRTDPLATTVSPRSSVEWVLRLAVAALGMTSVISLLAWVFGLGSFSAWFWAVSVPGVSLLLLGGIVVSRSGAFPDLRAALVLGTIAGLLGAAAYDLFRVPFVFVAGLRVLSPIESYGVLALGADASNPWTAFTGWAYHFSNGIGFGITYAALALRRHWAWGLLWAMILETGTVFTPFASAYQLAGRWDLIGIAYAAHVPYGLALGLIVWRADRWLGSLGEISRRTTTYTLIATAVALLVWLRPFSTPQEVRDGLALAPGASAAIVEGRFHPEWLRVAPGGCATLRNDDDVAYRIESARGAPLLVPGATERVCFDEPGVHRVRTSGAPFDGGFAIVDDALIR